MSLPQAGFRIGRRIGLAALALVLLGTVLLQRADAIGETRTLKLFNIHTKDDLTITYKKNGRFDDDALAKLNHFMRDWRQDKEVRMDPQLFDMLWEVHREVKATGPIHVVCGFRSPNTNEMLRGRSRASGVAKTSLHMQGKAIDFAIPSAEVADVRAATLRIQGGGVGYYPTSGIPFVHMDVGNVRHWPRMTRDQLVKVFPNGRTLHVPTDGDPLPGYQLALADRERGVRPSGRTEQPRSLIASLFGGGQQDSEEAEDNRATTTPATIARRAPAPTPVAAPVQVAAATTTLANIPLPLARPAAPASAPATFQVASAESIPVPAPAPRRPQVAAAMSPNQIVADRGFWQASSSDITPPAEVVARATPRVHTAAGQRGARERAAVDPVTTAGLGPFARPERPASAIALGYASQHEAQALAPVRNIAARSAAPATVTNNGTASVAMKPAAAPVPRKDGVRSVNDVERMNDPWLRGVAMAPSMAYAMTTTSFGVPDLRTLQPFMHKPAAAVAMSFSNDPGAGLSATAFTGSAVVFQATVTFGMRTAGLPAGASAR